MELFSQVFNSINVDSFQVLSPRKTDNLLVYLTMTLVQESHDVPDSEILPPIDAILYSKTQQNDVQNSIHKAVFILKN
jgi:hypothetical protein